jgi:hypothetical protein
MDIMKARDLKLRSNSLGERSAMSAISDRERRPTT